MNIEELKWSFIPKLESLPKRIVLPIIVATMVGDRWRDLGHWLLNRAPPAWTQVISHQNPDSHNSPQDQKMLFHLQGAMDDRINSKKLISPHTGLQIDQFFFVWDPDPIYIQV